MPPQSTGWMTLATETPVRLSFPSFSVGHGCCVSAGGKGLLLYMNQLFGEPIFGEEMVLGIHKDCNKGYIG